MSIDRQQIIRELQRLHRAGEPLNITSVKRRRPELIQAVYAVRPFWGWKQALADAGLDYRKIKIELRDTLDCALCGQSFHHLATHLFGKHAVSSDEYLMDYPESELLCEHLRAGMLKTEHVTIPHWEPVWSREYALDRLAEYRRQGFSIHQSKLAQYDLSLCLAFQRYWDGWKSAVMAMGLEPRALTEEAYRRLRRYPDKPSVLAAIKARQRAGLKLRPGSLWKSGPGEKGDCALFSTAGDLFGSWENALRAAGINPEVVLKAGSKRGKYQTAEAVIAAVRQRRQRQWPVNHGAVACGARADAALILAGGAYFGSWRNALRAAGIDARKLFAEGHRRRRRYPDRQTVLKAIRQRIRSGIPLTTASMTMGAQRDNILIRWGRAYFGSWRATLRAAGIDAQKIFAEGRRRRRRYRDRQAVLAAVRKRLENGIPVNSARMKMGAQRDNSLIKWGRAYFGSWRATLRAAGIDAQKLYAEVRLRRRRYRDRKSVLEAVRRRIRSGLPVNAAGVEKGKHRDSALSVWGKAYFGSWRSTLQAAGVNAKALYAELCRRKRRYPDRQSVLDEVKQRISRGLPVNATHMEKGKHRDKPLSICGRAYFGSWRATLRAAGIDAQRLFAEGHRRHRRYPDKQSVLDAVRKRIERPPRRGVL